MADNIKCSVCGETDPYPAWFCMMKATGSAKPGEPCSYSVEGHIRMTKQFREKHAATLTADMREGG